MPASHYAINSDETQAIYDRIEKDEDRPGVYIVSKGWSEQGLFYNGRMVIPVRDCRIDTFNFPFIEYSGDEGNFELNVMTGEKWKSVIQQGNIFVASQWGTDADWEYGYYTLDGKRIDVSKNNVSSKGLTPYRDEERKRQAYTGNRYHPHSCRRGKDRHDHWTHSGTRPSR